VRRQAAQALLAGEPDKVWLPTLRALALALSLGVAIDVVAELGGNDQLVAAPSQGGGDDLLGAAVAVSVAGVDEGDSQVDRAPQQGSALRVAVLAPPVRAERPGPEANFRHAKVGPWKGAIVHGSFLPPRLVRVYPRARGRRGCCGGRLPGRRGSRGGGG